MKRKLLSLALALGLVLTLLPAAALAAGETCPGGSSCGHLFEAGGLHFSSLNEAIGAAGAGGTVKLLDDFFYTAPNGEEAGMVFSLNLSPEGTSYTLDLNGYSYYLLDAQDGGADAIVSVLGDLTITDTSPEQSGWIFGQSYGVMVCPGASLTLEAGAIHGDISAVEICEGASFTMNGGTVDSLSTGEDDPDSIAYAISNFGTLTINGGGVYGEVPILNSALLENEGTATVCTINGGEITGELAGIMMTGRGAGENGYANQTDTPENDTLVLHLRGGTVTAPYGIYGGADDNTFAGFTINMSGGKIDGIAGIFLPDEGVTRITGGTIVSEEYAILFRVGDLSVANADITGNVESFSNGEVSIGRGTAIEGDVTNVSSGHMTITGAEITGTVRNTGEGGQITICDSTVGGVDLDDPSITVINTTVDGELVAPVLEPFTDVSEENWFYDAVVYAYENHLMNGTSDTLFSPNETLTRGMMVTLLHRLEGSPDVPNDYDIPWFTDITEGWYLDAVRWASAEGIVTGTSETTFAPNDSITREQLATMLYRYADYKGYDVTAAGGLDAFRDAGSVASYAEDAVAWAVEKGLMSGVDSVTLEPKGSATRAQAAAILMRFLENTAA